MKFRKLIPLLLVAVLLMLTACSSGEAEVATTISTTAIATLENTTEAKATTSELTTKNTETTKKAASTETTTKITTATATTKAQTQTVTTKATTKQTSQATTKPTTKATTKATTTKPQANSYCILTIECKEILNNMSDLKAGHEAYVPKSGYILSSYKVSYENGDTAYDILKKGCNDNGIKLTTTTDKTYVTGINNLDEFDCGKYSGWLYSVNSTFPGISCAKKKVQPNDNVTFKYTCKY